MSAAVGTTITRWWQWVPRWARLLLAALVLGLGVTIVFRPTLSLGVLAVLLGLGLLLMALLEVVPTLEAGEALEAGDEDHAAPRAVTWSGRVLAVLWLVAGVFVLAFPGLTVGLLVWIVGIGLIVSGALAVVRGLRRELPAAARTVELASGIATVVFGVVALRWADITLLIVSIVFGARLIFGALQLALRQWRPARAPRKARRGWGRAVAAVLTLVLALGTGLVSLGLRGASPVVDDFYAAPRTVPAAPGQLVRAEAFTRDVPEDARGWRILYTTTRGDGAPAVASALVVVPTASGAPTSGSAAGAPVIAWDHGTTGFAQQCAPSLAAEPFVSGALFVLPEVVQQGWALIATDYIGLGTVGPHPYLIGPDSAHATLDAVRAARQLDGVQLAEQTVVWGHSQGGAAALWTNALAAEYAPDVPLSGTAALAPAANLPELLRNLPEVPGGSVFASFAVSAYVANYPEITFRDYIRPGAEATLRAMAGRCLAEPSLLVSVLSALGMSQDPEIFSTDATEGALGTRLSENIPPIPQGAPVLIGQGGSDSLVTPRSQAAYVLAACRSGVSIDYRSYAGRQHVSLVEADSPAIAELVAWTHDRFAGAPAASSCSQVH